MHPSRCAATTPPVPSSAVPSHASRVRGVEGVVAAAGAAAGWVYLRVRRLLSGALARCGPIPVQTLVATALFAALAAAVPRKFGHDE